MKQTEFKSLELSDFSENSHVRKKPLQVTLDFEVNKNNITYKSMSSEKVTFKGGLEFPIHNWFILTPSFSPYLVNEMLLDMNTKKNHVVLDPFSGIGTTLIECKKNGIASIGVEINPFFHKTIKTEINWDIDPVTLENAISDLMEIINSVQLDLRNGSIQDLLEYYHIELPKLYNIFRWWNEDVLIDLLIVRESIKKLDFSTDIKEVLECGLGCILVDVANVTRNRLQLAFIGRQGEYIDVFGELKTKLHQILGDVKSIKNFDSTIPCKIINGDSTELDELLDPCSIDRVVTSPPYPNRYSYVWNTRAHLFFFDIFTKASQSAELDINTIGGTWGKATSILKDGIIEPHNDIVEKEVGEVVENIRIKSNLMANYVMKYFNLMAKHIESLNPVLSSNAKCAYVVGNSEIKGQFVKTDEILGNMFVDYGFNNYKIVRVRKRNSGAGLHEAIVYANK